MRTFKENLVPLPKCENPEISKFSKYKKVCLEIGCGVGMHPVKIAIKNKDQYFIAIEHTKNKFDKFWNRYLSHKAPDNLLPVHANAISWVTHFIRPESIDKIFILYPNPNPKKKDINKRWHAMPFMQKLIQVLKPNGELEIATNMEWYAYEAIDYLKKDFKMSLINHKRLDKNITNYRTHFESKYIKSGHRCHNLLFSL